MKLVRLEIQSLPGIEPGFVLADIPPGISIITGSNAVGKSSLIRALRYLVTEPQSDDPPALSLAAEFQSDGTHWTVRRTGREIEWQQNGRPATRPPLPDRDQLRSYWLSMEDLLRADEGDELLVSELRRALSGGYDLEALRRGKPFDLGPRIGQNEARELRAKQKTLREVEASYEALRREEARVPSLESKIEAAREANAQAQRLQKALDLLDARIECSEIEAGLTVFPQGMERLRGDELGRLQQQDSKRNELRTDIQLQARELETAQQRLRETGLSDGQPEGAELDAWDRTLQEAQQKAVTREQETERLEQSAAAESQALLALGGTRNAPSLDPESVSEAESLALELQSTERRRQEFIDRIEEAGEAPEQSILDGHDEAARSLRAWLASGEGATKGLILAIVIAGVGGLLAVVTALLAQAWAALICGCVGLVGAMWAFVESRRGRNASARERFAKTGLEEPKAWQRELVEAHLGDIERRLAELRQQVVKARLAEETRRRLASVEQELQELRRQKTALAERIGFDPGLTAAALDRFVRLVQNYERAHQDHEGATAKTERLNAEIDGLVAGVAEFLTRWQTSPITDEDLNALAAHVDDLKERVRRAREAQRDIDESGREVERLEQEQVECDRNEADLFQGCGLDVGQRTDLVDRVGQRDAWREHEERLRNARVVEAERTKGLEGEDELLGRLQAEERECLDQEFEGARGVAAELEELQQELTTILTHLDLAGRDGELETALADVESARGWLADRYHETLFSEAAHFLLDSVEQEYRSEHEPDVLRDARERFQRFTHHAFALELDKDEGFMARDLQQMALRSLSELSSATRMQLLLATRLAWTARLEQGRETLPLFLDEALTTSDEHRFAQVAESIDQLAQDEGRQVFYLSARRHETTMWERATGTQPYHIDLDAVRFGRSDAQPEDFILPALDPLPAPADHSPESYAVELGVPFVDPWQPGGSIHLFHLLRDDLPLLHRLMESLRVTTLGQLESLLRSNAVADVISDGELRLRLEARCAAAHAWVAAWRQGRGKPVDRIALEQSDAVSDAFMDGAVALAESLNGDGIGLINALRDKQLSRFRDRSINDLEQWMKAEGYIDPAEVLTPESRQQRTFEDTDGGATTEGILQVIQWLEGSVGHRSC